MILGLVAALVLGLAPEAGESNTTYEVYFHLEATLSSAALDAKVLASARLEMAAEPGEGGALRLSLLRLLGPAWKYYRVDPAGPMGREAKLAAVVALPSPTWDEVERMRAAMDRFGAEQHRLAGSAGQRFDGAFSFLIIGPERGRFIVELDSGGRLLSAHDGLTERWLPGELDPLLKAWATAAPGYWFWNRGERQPPSWEPHTVHALVAALDLLALPTAPASGKNQGETTAGPFSLELPGAAEAVVAVLSTLAPKTRGRIEASGSASAEVRVVREGDGVVERTIVARGEGRLDFSRHQRLEARSGRAISDEIVATLTSEGSRILLRVGLRPRS